MTLDRCVVLYELGVELRAAHAGGYPAAVEAWIYGTLTLSRPASAVAWDVPGADAWLEAGYRGLARPVLATGWRYGAIPPAGYSVNHRDGTLERGVSLMAVDGCDARPDGTYSLFNGGPVVRVRGVLLPFRGSDGEPLMIDCAAE